MGYNKRYTSTARLEGVTNADVDALIADFTNSPAINNVIIRGREDVDEEHLEKLSRFVKTHPCVTQFEYYETKEDDCMVNSLATAIFNNPHLTKCHMALARSASKERQDALAQTLNDHLRFSKNILEVYPENEEMHKICEANKAATEKLILGIAQEMQAYGIDATQFAPFGKHLITPSTPPETLQAIKTRLPAIICMLRDTGKYSETHIIQLFCYLQSKAAAAGKDLEIEKYFDPSQIESVLGQKPVAGKFTLRYYHRRKAETPGANDNFESL